MQQISSALIDSRDHGTAAGARDTNELPAKAKGSGVRRSLL